MNKYILGIDVGKINMGYSLFNGTNLYFNLFNIESHISNAKLKDVKKNRTIIIYKFLEQIKSKFDVSKIVLEQQMKVNPTAQSIEEAIITIAYIFNIDVITYSAKKKFKYNNETFNSKKKEHKRISEHYCKNIISHLGYTLDYFNSFKKKDDISDATCMAVFTYIEKYHKKNATDIIRYLIN